MHNSATPREVRELLDFATTIAHEAGDLTLRHYGGRVAHEAKGDGSPVTIADKSAEELLRGRIEARYPEHSILGEEFGDSRDGARVRWILDPIDATRSFMRGVPLYGVLIGIEIDAKAVVGVCHFPPLHETVAAGEGLGCTWNGEPCRVSAIDRIEDALVLTTDIPRIVSGPQGPGWLRLQERADLSRTWGDCYGHALVATGRAEVMVDPIQASWDGGPFLTILTEAGGRFTTVDGRPVLHGGSGVSTNGLLHEEVIRELNG